MEFFRVPKVSILWHLGLWRILSTSTLPSSARIQKLEKSSSSFWDLQHHSCQSPVIQTEGGWQTASSGYFSIFLYKNFCAIRILFWHSEGKNRKKMPFDFAGLKNQVLKPGKEEVKNTMGDSLGKLQRWDGSFIWKKCTNKA